MSKRSLSVTASLSAILLTSVCSTPAAEPRASAAVPAPSASPAAAANTGELVYLRNLGQNGELIVLDADTGKEVERFTAGVTTPDWSLVYEALTSGNTLVRATDLKRKVTTAERLVQGAGAYTYQLPVVTFTGEPGGFSPNAHWLALSTRVGYSSGGATTNSPFVVLDSKLQNPAKFVELPGNFTFDAISDSGKFLYLEEHLGTNGADGYRVRAYDLQAGQLLPGIVVDKTVAADRMAGNRVSTIASPDGEWQFTLYWRQGGNPFIHAIKLEESWSLCLFLPVQTSGEEDFAWSFVASPDGRTAYAINSLKGYVASIDLMKASVIKTATLDFQRASAPSFLDAIVGFFAPIAEAKSEMFSVGVVSPDGKTLYAVGDFGRKLFAISTDTLSVKGRYSISQVVALGISPNGTRLYGIDAEGNSLLHIDASTGRVLAKITLPGRYAGRILRVAAR